MAFVAQHQLVIVTQKSVLELVWVLASCNHRLGREGLFRDTLEFHPLQGGLVWRHVVTILLVILVLAGLAWFFARTGTVKGQVRFYLKKYRNARAAGQSHDDAIESLVKFYLRGESADRQRWFREHLPEFKQDLDRLILAIINAYFILDRLEKEPRMVLENRIKFKAMMSVIPAQCAKYTILYKRKFGIT